MNINTTGKAQRRDFLKGAGALACGLAIANPTHAIGEAPPSKISHKFDQLRDKKLSFRKHIDLRYKELIRAMKGMMKDMGRDKVIALLKNRSTENGTSAGTRQASNSASNDFPSFIQFLDSPFLKQRLTFEYVEKTDTTCEIKVTECLWADVFITRDAGDIGNAYICHGDYAHCQAFNSNIKITRDKTLMQGHYCCNHRYELKS